MKSTDQLQKEISELKQTGLDLYERAEQWRKALEEISRFNKCPVISSIIQSNLNK